LHNGLLFQVNPKEHLQKDIFWYGFYEKKYVLAWELLIQSNFLVADIGANAGYYSMVASKKITSGTVYAFEPNAGCRKMIEENIRINKIKNISVSPLALSNNSGVKTLFISEDDNIGMTGFTKAENFSGKTEVVACTSLDLWVDENKIEKLHLIKMDIEGGEMDALEGMKNVIQFHRPGIFIEICNELLQRFGNSSQDIFSFFEGYQYHGFRINAANEIQKMHEPFEDELVLFLPQEYVIPGDFTILN
jgi:FkbM family methyltransferase